MTNRSRHDHPDRFWATQAKPYRLDQAASTKASRTRQTSTGDVRVRWFEDGVLNASANCLDKHLATRPDQVAIIWEGDDPDQHPKKSLTRQLHMPKSAASPTG